MHLSDVKEVIKARDVHLIHSAEKVPIKFIPDQYHIPATETNGHMTGDAGNNQPKKNREAVEAKQRAVEKEAYHKGFSKGVTEGMARERKNLCQTTELVAKLNRELNTLNVNFLKNNKKTILDLAFAIAARVIHKEVSTDRQIILSVLEDALRDIQDRQGAKILLSPEDYRCVTEAPPAFLDQCRDILFERDEKIAPGGVVIEGPTGIVDARLDQQFYKIKDALYDGHRR